MSVVRIAHVSDTHFATAADAAAMKPRLVRAAPHFARLFTTARDAIVAAHGCNSQEPRLFKLLTNELRRLASSDIRPGFVVHTGDISQAGQLGSIDAALTAIKKAADVDVLAIAGNHDVWPEDFPAFAPSRTPLQVERLRRSGLVPPRYCHVHPRQGIELLLLESASADALLNITALGSVDADLDHSFAYRPQLPPQPAQQAPIRAAVMHHPPQDLHGASASWCRRSRQSDGI